MMRSVDSSVAAQALLGDLVEVVKMSPGVSDVHTPRPLTPIRVKRKVVTKRAPMTPEQRKQRQELERKVAQVSNVVGLGAGIGGTGAAVRAYKESKKATELGPQMAKVKRLRALSTPTKRKLAVLGAGSALGLQVGNVAGDVVTARVLGAKKEDASKGIPMPKLFKGRIGSMRRALGNRIAGTPKPPAPSGANPHVQAMFDAGQSGQAARAAVDEKVKGGLQGAKEFVKTPGGKATVGVAAVGVPYMEGKRRGAAQAQMTPYGPVYKRHDVEIAGTFSKFDNDKKRAYGWASVVTLDGEPVIDKQGDYIGLEDIEEAAYTYVRKSRVAGDMHRRTQGEDGSDAPHKAGELIESVVFTPDKCHAMGLPASFAGKWWMGVQVEDDEVWAEVKKGNRTGFSIHGKGLRKETTLDDIKAGR